LFNHLRGLTNRSEAARLCELERRTTYYWEDDREVRLSTKQRVLRAILERDFTYTVRYVLERIDGVSHEILELYLGTIYEKAMDPEIQPAQFRSLVNEFRDARTKYSPLVDSMIATEVSDMFRNLRRRAAEQGVAFPPLPMSTMSIGEIRNQLPYLIRVVPRSINDDVLREFSTNLDFSQDFVKFASNLKTIGFPLSAETVTKDAVNSPSLAIVRRLEDGKNIPPEILDHTTREEIRNFEKIEFMQTSGSSGVIVQSHVQTS